MNSKGKSLIEAAEALTYFSKSEIEEVVNYFSQDEHLDIRKLLNERKFRLKSSTYGYRTINHWESVGAFTTDRGTKTNGKKGWREFGMIELLWISCIDSMRNFGLPLPTIVLIGNQLRFGEGSEHSILEYFIWKTMTKHIPVFLKIYSNGDVKIVSDEDYLASCEDEGSSDHLIVSLSKAMKKHFPSIFEVDPIYFSRHKHSLKHEEWELIKELRNANYQSVKVRLKDGEIELIEGIENLQVKERLVDILKQGSFQDVELKQVAGSVVSIRRTRKKKF
ncbi:MAG: hypothetical protein JXQ90_18180 [Cyclobacteriaceae bacterium]